MNWLGRIIDVLRRWWRGSISENTSQTIMHAENINIGGYYNGGTEIKISMGVVSSKTIDYIEVMTEEEFKALPEQKDRTLYLTMK